MSISPWFKLMSVVFAGCTLGGCSVQSFVMKQLFVPRMEFDSQSVPEAPDYAQPETWASLPEIVDNADLRLPGAAESEGGLPVFFVHPTTFLDRRSWLEEPSVEHASLELLEEIVLPSMVSMFNECCDISVPRYRAATVGAFYVSPEEATPVFEIA